jgi:hypothetical protein
MKPSKILLSYKEDILERGLLDWIISHTSFLLPSHKYKGIIELVDGQLVITLHDSNKIIVNPTNLSDIHYGFDEVFRFGNDRSMGLSFKPLRLTYKLDNELEKVAYIITDFNRFTRGSNNKNWYNTLNEWKQNTEFLEN